VSWSYDNIESEYIYNDSCYGIVHDVHVTILSDIIDKKINNIQMAIESETKFECIFGEMRLFLTNSKFDVLYVPVVNEEIYKVNKNLSNCIEHNKFYSEYIPHVTLCYLQKGYGQKFLKNNYFNEKGFFVNELIYSTPNNKSTFRLGIK
jgi:2'-5' RNA ligase